MRGALIGAGLAVVLAACGGQSAEQQRVAKCQAQAQQSAENFAAGLPNQTAASTAALAQSYARVCIDSGQKP